MSLKKNTIANYLGQGWTALMGLAFVPVYIHYLGVEAWGLVGFMSLLQAWLTLLDMGLTPTLSREMARYQAGALSAQSIRDLLRSLEMIYGGVAIAVIGIVWLIAPWIAANWLSASQLSQASMMHAISMIGVVLASRMAEQVYRGAVQGLQKQVWLNAAQSALATLRWAGAALVLAWVTPDIEAFFLWQGLVSVISVCILARQTYSWLPKGERAACFDFSEIMRIRRFAGGMAATTLLALLLTQVDKILLSKMVSLEEFGYYTLAASAAGALYFLVLPISSAASPRLTELVTKSDQAALIETYHRTSQWMAVLLMPVAIVMAVFSEPVLLVWTGNADLAKQAAPLLAVLTIGNLFNGLMHVPYMTQLAYGWTGFAVRVNMVAVLFIVPAILWSVPRYGAIGAAWAWVVLNVGYVMIGMHYMHRKILIGEKNRWYKHAILAPIVAGSISAIVVKSVFEIPESRVMKLLMLILIFFLVSMAVALMVPIARAYVKNRFKVFQ